MQYITRYLQYGICMCILGMMTGCYFSSSIFAADWDARIDIDTDFSVVSGDTVEYTVQLFNDEVDGSYTDIGAQLEVSYDGAGLEYVSEGTYTPVGIATLASSSGNMLVWDINGFTPTTSDDIFIRFTMRGLMVGNFLTLAEIIPSGSAPTEESTSNNTVAIPIAVTTATIDGECGTAHAGRYYSGYVFNTSPELCTVGYAQSTSPTNPNQPTVSTGGFDWQCRSLNGGNDVTCHAEIRYCGDAIQDPEETCDDGNTNNTDSCLTTCEVASCGDSFVEAGVEACDDGNTDNTDSCLTTCEVASCGDSFVEAGVEACDDGNTNNTDSCLTTCEVASCGDSFVEAGVEACDDGNSISDDGCDTSCQWEIPSCTMMLAPGTGLAPLPVTATVSFPSWASIHQINWQDGIINQHTGHTYITTGSFLAELTLENNLNNAITNSCTDLVQVSTECGNALVEIGETCDDGNEDSGDGCSESCRIEVCGDGVVNNNATETCDDGNTNNMDACPNDCQLAVCGDDVVEGFEECDDGNTDIDDGCSDICEHEGRQPGPSGSTHAVSKSPTSSFVAQTASIFTILGNQKASQTDNSEEDIQALEEIEDDDKDKENAHHVALSLLDVIRSRNFSIIEVIKQRNTYLAQIKLLHTTIKERNVRGLIEEHAVASTDEVEIQKTESSSKSSIRAVLLRYLQTK